MKRELELSRGTCYQPKIAGKDYTNTQFKKYKNILKPEKGTGILKNCNDSHPRVRGKKNSVVSFFLSHGR